ncbi:hypothetical protein SZ25_00837 [Candidatus Arcanobacter lacustris]|jgi:hypothetical protein|uniref:Uncharacterized protein n=1 Tax=Candidatus Arcanibacter lacustris TaxID=1607817 RepID=A0A0F5MPS7_9RICK|nr:hypothetical protein SZ25_00843 [Candidatus Arcanobacter lacustris]KKB96078.1 hypothetical protein SZ25_00837 [Candidatus Arcanobacter lacustris]
MSIINKIKNLLGDHHIENEILVLNKLVQEEEAVQATFHTGNMKAPVIAKKEYHHVNTIEDIIDQMKK